MKPIKITNIDFHRNGISGETFHVILFRFEKRDMIGIVFDEPMRTAVLNVGLAAQGEIRFGYNSWHGDSFDEQLRVAITQFDKDEEWKERYGKK